MPLLVSKLGFFSRLNIGDYKYRRTYRVFVISLKTILYPSNKKITQLSCAFLQQQNLTMHFRHLVFLLACSAASIHARPGPVPDDETSACDKEIGAQCSLEPDCEDLGRYCCTGSLSSNNGNQTNCIACMSPTCFFPY